MRLIETTHHLKEESMLAAQVTVTFPSDLMVKSAGC